MRPEKNLDALFAIGNKQRETNYACGMTQDGVDWLTGQWVQGLWLYQGMPREVGIALLRRWGLPVTLLESKRSEVDDTSDLR